MMTKDLRRTERIPSQERVSVGWADSSGSPKFVLAKCLNISEEGISLRVAEPVPVRTYVTLRCEKLKIAEHASVKYCVRQNSWYQIGLEFTPGSFN
jgi:hypothetical protein